MDRKHVVDRHVRHWKPTSDEIELALGRELVECEELRAVCRDGLEQLVVLVKVRHLARAAAETQAELRARRNLSAPKLGKRGIALFGSTHTHIGCESRHIA